LQEQVEQAWKTGADEATWIELLEQEEVGNAARVASALVGFSNETATRQIDSLSLERLQRFIPLLLAEVAKSDRPLRAITRTLSIVERILRRSAYLALLNENRGALARLVDLCARSHYIADQISRYPALLDELLDPRLYSDAVSRADLSAELSKRLAGENDSESCMQVLGQFQRSTMFRIAVADFNGELPIMKVSDGLTWLAETVLEEALRVAWRDLAERHGTPKYRINDVEREAGFGIIAYGKLGGLELSYGSDLDIVFLHDSTGTQQMTDGDKPLDNGLFFSRLVRRLVHFLTTQTGSGQLYEIDTRLRPDGRRGLLVTSTDAFERYQEDNAWTWEHQALLRARAVAGSAAVADEFERIRRETLIGRVRRDTLRDDVIKMRQRMRKELDRSSGDLFDLKHGRGGIGDIEFLVQYLVLDQAQVKPDVIFYSDNIRQLDALTAEGCLDQAVGDALQDAYRDYRLRQHHLVLDDRPPLVPVDEFVEQQAFVVKTWDDWLG
jgi:glutamate-ammonia-ligase adenylyltransferase